MTKVEFTSALMDAWHLQPMGANESKRLQAMIDKAWELHRVAEPSARVVEEAVLCAKYYANQLAISKGGVSCHRMSPKAAREMMNKAEATVRARMVLVR